MNGLLAARWRGISAAGAFVSGLLCASSATAADIPFWKKMSRSSYGLLKPGQPQYCDRRQAGQAGSTAEQVVTGIFGFIFRPIEGALMYDDVLVQEQLQDQFRNISDSGMPPVIVLSRDNKEIVFLWGMGLVLLTEVANAAQKYCSNVRVGLNATYEGSSRSCERFSGGYVTRVISVYGCR